MKVAVFIDNSNVFRSIQYKRKTDKTWQLFYDPLHFAKRLAGARELVEVCFYCTKPPEYLLKEDEYHQKIYKKTIQYYAAIEQLPKVRIKYGILHGVRGRLVEKNLDTQLTADLIIGAAKGVYDVAMLVSNDGDFVSAVKGANVFGKRVEIAFFSRHISMHLKAVAHVARRIRKSFLIPLLFVI